jgi:hypothetical protein
MPNIKELFIDAHLKDEEKQRRDCLSAEVSPTNLVRQNSVVDEMINILRKEKKTSDGGSDIQKVCKSDFQGYVRKKLKEIRKRQKYLKSGSGMNLNRSIEIQKSPLLMPYNTENIRCFEPIELNNRKRSRSSIISAMKTTSRVKIFSSKTPKIKDLHKIKVFTPLRKIKVSRFHQAATTKFNTVIE